MGAGFEFAMDIDTSGARRGSNDLADSIDKVTDALAESGDAAEKAQRKSDDAAKVTGRQFGLLAREMQNYARDTGKSYQEAFEDLERHARESGEAIDDKIMRALKEMASRGPSDVDKVKDAFRDLRRETGDPIEIEVEVDKDNRVSGRLADLKDEAAQSAYESGGEWASNFDGSAEGAIDGLSEVMAEIGQAAGPVGGPLILAATALGALFAQNYMKNAEAVKEMTSSMFDDLAESGAAALSEGFYDAQIKEWLDQNSSQFKNAKALGEQYGIDVGTALRGMAGDADAAAATLAAIDQASGGLLTREEEIFTALSNTNLTFDERKALALEAADVQREYGRLVNDYRGHVESAAQSEDSARAKAEALLSARRAGSDATRAAIEAEADLQSALSDATTALDDAETSTADKRVAVLEAIDAVRAMASAEASLKGSVEAGSVVIDANRDALYEMGERAGLSREDVEHLIGTVDAIPEAKTTDITVDDDGTAAATQRRVDAVHGKNVTVGVDLDTWHLENFFRTFQPTVTATIKAGPLAGMPAGSGVLRP